MYTHVYACVYIYIYIYNNYSTLCPCCPKSQPVDQSSAKPLQALMGGPAKPLQAFRGGPLSPVRPSGGAR